ncbi:mycofactocin-coupled SDR family oxidoreductase [Geodermatophilus amargosae]|uniref:mycofactocin-coupled SDR family oxidoreductase n=1 Tax=Geodermatophilus amargosae TaxID=1296565 RepID=UPI0034DE7F77
MAGRVEGRVALVTGAARGMGRAHAVRLAAEGADVVLVDVCGELPDVACPPATEQDLDETVRQVQAQGRRAVRAVVDARDLAGLTEAADRGGAELGRLDVVVANAGICSPRAWDQVAPEVFASTLDVDVTGVWNTVMATAPHLVRAGGGSIVLVSSAAGLKVQPFMVHYTTSTWAVRGRAKAFAAELAQHSIRVNSLHPTAVATGMGGGDMQAALGAAIGGDPRLAGMFTNLLPVDVTQPEDVADVVLFLASDESRYVTSHEMAVDAGVSEF